MVRLAIPEAEPLNAVLRDMMTAYSYGVKTLYYHNTRDGADDNMAEVMLAESDDCAGGGCKI